MKCPKCHKAPLSFGQFVISNGPLKLNCSHCQTPLKGDLLLRVAYYATLIFAVLFGLRVYGFQQQGGLSIIEMMLILIGFVVMTLILKGALAWHFGNYIREKD